MILVVVSTRPVQFLALVWFVVVVTWAARGRQSQPNHDSVAEYNWARHDSTLHDLSNAMTASMFMVRDITRALEKVSDANLRRALRLSKDLAAELAQLSDHIRSSRQTVRLQLTAAIRTSVLLPVHQSVEQVSRLFPDVKFEVICDLPEQDAHVNVTGGPATLKRIVENLLINACQAQSTVQEKQVKCSIVLNPRSVVLMVTDSGPGFPNAILQSHPSPLVSTKLGGSGMGLYSCHQLTHRDGGQLSIANRSDGGALVTVSWPRVPVSATTTVPPVSSTIQRSGLRVRPEEYEMDTEMAKRRS